MLEKLKFSAKSTDDITETLMDNQFAQIPNDEVQRNFVGYWKYYQYQTKNFQNQTKKFQNQTKNFQYDIDPAANDNQITFFVEKLEKIPSDAYLWVYDFATKKW